MSATEGTNRLKQISRSLQELDQTWHTVNPSAADQLARLYEQRSLLWKKKIALQSAALMLVQAVSIEGDCLADSTVMQSESEDAQTEDAEFNASSIVDNAQIQSQIDETRAILEKCPLVWNDITSTKARLSETISLLLDSQVKELESRKDADWAEVCDMMKGQRDGLLEDIERGKKRLAYIESSEAEPILQSLHEQTSALRKVKADLDTCAAARTKMEQLLEEYHGIIVPESSPQGNQENVDDYLNEEQETVMTYYEAKVKRNSRIFTITQAKDSVTNDIHVTVTPKSDWLEFWRRKKPDHPGLKYMTVTYTRNSVYPTNIAIKVNTSSVSETAYEAVIGPLVQRIQEWKQKMMQSPCIDLHGLVRLFL